MAKIKVEISGDTALILSGVTFKPKSGKICIHTKGGSNPNRNIALIKGEKASWEFDIGQELEDIGNKPIFKVNYPRLKAGGMSREGCGQLID